MTDENVQINKQATSVKQGGLVEVLNSIPAKLSGLLKRGQTSQTTTENTVLPTSTPKMPKIKIPKKLIVAVVVMVILFILLMVVVSMIGKGNGVIGIPTSTPAGSPTPTPIIEVPTQYADDEDVAEMIERMKELDEGLNSANFRDDRLRIPALDWDVSF